jgi:hypothetical protein
MYQLICAGTDRPFQVRPARTEPKCSRVRHFALCPELASTGLSLRSAGGGSAAAAFSVAVVGQGKTRRRPLLNLLNPCRRPSHHRTRPPAYHSNRETEGKTVAAPAPPDWHFCSLTDKARKIPETCRAQGPQYCFFDRRSGSGAVRPEKPAPCEIAGVFPSGRRSMREKLESLPFVRSSITARLSAHLLTAGCRVGAAPWAQARAWSDARSILTDMAICTSTLEGRNFGGWCRRVQPDSSGVFEGPSRPPRRPQAIVVQAT